MTHRELKRKYAAVNQQYETLLSLVIALARQQNGLFVERRFVEDQAHAWMIETNPNANGDGVTIAAHMKHTAARLVQ